MNEENSIFFFISVALSKFTTIQKDNIRAIYLLLCSNHETKKIHLGSVFDFLMAPHFKNKADTIVWQVCICQWLKL
jgi:hypothetical protein